ncbi:hypothetical protein [Streptomyces antimycoticus]|uniref:hypothetical protein n=1 Tax=Streptomyces antimycoticus TaxID=68175 RepID=UPI003408364F|nr:hypothetical protein OG546_01330 [Streptomyces antimycoticus]
MVMSLSAATRGVCRLRHVAQICRDWVADFAHPAVFGARPATAAHGSLPGTARHAGPRAEADVVVRGRIDADSGPCCRSKWRAGTRPLDPHYLERLRHLRDPLAADGEDVTHARPACCSGVGSTPALSTAEADGQVVLVGLDRLYREE